MRQLILTIPVGNRDRILHAVDQFEGRKVITIPKGKHDVFLVLLPVKFVQNFLITIGDITETA